MDKKSYLAASLAICVIGAAFIGLTAKALPNHLVAGGVFGPGNDKSPGATNPANAVGTVYYSTTQPSYTIIAGADSFTPADGTDPAIYATDVGNVWDWLNGDEMVVVFETIKGVSGWTGSNHTTSLTAALATGDPTQDVGNVTLEVFPTLTLTSGSNYVNATWSPLADAGNNVQSYKVYRGVTSVGTVQDAPGLRYLNDTGLSPGPVCYQLSVNYRRDTVGGLYETTGRSNVACAVVGTPPRVTVKDPTDNAVNVPLTKDIVVTFSEAMNIGTVTYALTPSLTLSPAWTVGNTVLTLTHSTAFTVCQSYQVDITGKDLDGIDLAPTPTTWTFTALCDLPFIVTTSPADGAQQVRANTQIVVTFSEAMNTASVTATANPSLTFTPAWTVGDTVLTLTASPAPTTGTSYTITVAGQDTTGNSLIAGPVPNPWTFTVNTPPTVTMDPTDTLVGRCCSGGSVLDLPWTMGDTETSLGQLKVWLNYTLGVTTNPIAGPLTGRTSPDSYPWTTPASAGNLTIWITVMDEAGEKAQDSSATFKLDSSIPAVLSVSPANSATSVVLDAQVVVRFSEPMKTSTVVIWFSPAVSNAAYAWDSVHMNVTVSHANFVASTPYTLTINATATDDCTPGNPLAAAFSWTFTTGTGLKAPNPPTNLAIASQAYNSIGLTWNAPTQYTDGSQLLSSEIKSYRVYRSLTSTPPGMPIATVTTAAYTDTSVEQEKTYYYWVTAVNNSDVESSYSVPVSVTVPKQTSAGFDWMWIVIILIVILVIVGLILMLGRRKKPEAAPEEPAEGEEAPPVPEEAPEETPPAETPPAETPPAESPPPSTPPEEPPKEEPAKEGSPPP